MIYLTGGNGFIGKSIYQFLRKKQLQVHKLQREYLENLPSVSYEKNYLIHCAWNGLHSSERKSDELQSSNIRLTKTIIKVLKALKIDKVIAFGSQAEYGIVNKNIKETFPLKPLEPYGLNKVISSRILSSFCESEKKKLIWLRLFDAYGPGDNIKWLIPYVINSALNDFSPKLSTCSQVWDFLYIDDICNCIYKIINFENDKSDFYNLSSNKEIVIKDIIENIFQIIKPLNAKPLYGEKENNNLFYLNGDNKKLKLKYDWCINKSMDQGLIETIEFYKRLKSLNQ